MTEICWLKEAITPTNANKGGTNFRDAVTKMRKRKDGEDISRNDGEKKRKEKKKDSRNRGGGRGGGEGASLLFRAFRSVFSAVRKIKSSSITTLEVIMTISEATLAPAISSTRTAVFA